MIRFDREGYLRLIRGHGGGLRDRLARGGLSAVAAGYAVAIAARNRGFDLGWLRSHRAEVPVVSVGNLTLGGTGKTPMVEWLGRWYRPRGVRVAILSRGYGQAQGMNDEGRVLEENLPDVPHLQNPDRVALAHVAVRELETELIVLDDGFQHRRLARDLDVVLLDAFRAVRARASFSEGLLRESRFGPLRLAGGGRAVPRSDLITALVVTAIRSTRAKTQQLARLGGERDLAHRSTSSMVRETRLRWQSSRGSRWWLFAGSATPRGFAAP